jgi:hypothetical protein
MIVSPVIVTAPGLCAIMIEGASGVKTHPDQKRQEFDPEKAQSIDKREYFKRDIPKKQRSLKDLLLAGRVSTKR